MTREITDLLKIAGQKVERSTINGLKVASAKSGVSFQYLVAKAAQESGLKTDAQATTSSAAGLFQFTRSTWLDMMKRNGEHYGYGELAEKITTDASGKSVVKDPAAEQRILALREDPEASGLMAAEYARDNATSLHDQLGRTVDAPDLYLAHFLGASGASQLLNTAEDTPTKSAASVLPAAAKANQSVFYTPEGRARSAADVVALVRERFSGQMDRFADAATPAPVAIAKATTPTTAPRFLPAPTADDPSRAMVSHFIVQELAKMIASKPMMPVEGGDDSTSLQSSGLQGTDWTAAMSESFAKDMMPVKQAVAQTLKNARMAAPGDADMASQAYAAFGTRPRKNDLG
jgi:hypothetical protein